MLKDNTPHVRLTSVRQCSTPIPTVRDNDKHALPQKKDNRARPRLTFFA